jgi:AmmeMemoRadiSam system protein B
MDRDPVVAGQFYPAGATSLSAEVGRYLSQAAPPSGRPSLAAMAPHAGYVFSGAVAGRTLGEASLAATVILLGPNHTGMGRPLALWPDGRWNFPGGSLAVDEELARALLDSGAGLAADEKAHLREHSLEVMVPFLWARNPDTAIVPIAVAEPRLAGLEALGLALARTITAFPRPVSLVVSSDMSHFLDQDRTQAQDRLALDAVLALDPAGLLSVVRANEISMCGVLPMTAALFAAKALGATSARLVAYSTSGDVNGDRSRVVGYAGVIVE